MTSRELNNLVLKIKEIAIVAIWLTTGKSLIKIKILNQERLCVFAQLYNML